jgi:hypothetical protein
VQPCVGTNQLDLSNPSVSGPDGGSPSANQAGAISVVLTNNGAKAYAYPCVGFAANNPAITFAKVPAVSVYSLAPGASATFSTRLQFAPSVSTGTVVHFTASVGVPDATCMIVTKQLGWDVTLQ